ncbi:ABC transporter substrate-binding protein [Ornithinimicrobium humiphilum]|uniref:Iron complex transport system substrate-binding protein n=1 Tax=Ornithinimicrobium humiphilum TaxID=125288 RepID=A0A543K823_9MICO|nr:iron-siderophore ABC transporter substrate-binding protein [Ornithinimicrobium humiphilum]TQM91239.1 iron complex transport system substrate-binding protein [Ornithinimicrobium humiphilum]
MTALPRRTARLGALVLTASLALTACSTGPSGSASSDDTADGGTTEDSGATSDDTAAADGDTGTFPTTVEHAFGETTIESDPQRVVTVGWTDHEIMAALGEVPIAAVKINWGGNDAGSTDWFDEAVTELGADPADITRYDDSDGIPVDEIAALEPDLIIGSNSGMSQEDYDRLSKIAPTVAYPEQPWSTPWRESVELVGQAIGRPDQAEQAIADTEAAFEATQEKYPQLEGTSFAWGWFTPTDTSTIGLYTVTDLRPQFLTELGMVNSPVVEELSTAGTFSANLSAEQADTLDADVFVFYVDGEFGAEQVLADPLLSQIPAMANGAYVASADQQAALGMSSPTPLSIPVALETFIPDVAEAAAKAAEASPR